MCCECPYGFFKEAFYFNVQFLTKPAHLKRPRGPLQPYTNYSSNQWYTLEVDFRAVAFNESGVGC